MTYFERISDTEREEESVADAIFQEMRPHLLGKILDTLVKALQIKPTVKLNKKPRMADFAVWGVAIAKALGGEYEDKFLDAYYEILERQNVNAVEVTLIGPALVRWFSEKLPADKNNDDLLDQKKSYYWEGTPETLLRILTELGPSFGIDVKSKRPSKIQLEATLRKIRHLLAEGYTNKEIIETLQLEERTFYHYMKRIYAQDKAYFEQQDNESIATEIRLAKERTLKSLRRYDAIAADENLSAAERMEAERCRGDIVITLAKIELEGPRIMYETSRRLYDHQYRQQQEQQQLKNGNNIAAAFEPSRQREICSRMMIGQGGYTG